jgi:hypothetical protein
LGFVIACVLLSGAQAQQLQVPKQVVAGNAFSIPTHGSGDAIFYLQGPGVAAKRKVQLGGAVQVAEEETRNAGRYIAALCSSDGCQGADFFVTATGPAHISFLVHPSRVPVATNDAISATAFVFDKFHNLVLQPVKVNFRVSLKDAPELARSETTSNGVAWMSMNSSHKGGLAQVTASLDDITEKRVVQQVPSDACNLRIRAARAGRFIDVETDPVRDCSGNPVPDGTIVSITELSDKGKTTIDTPIKRGIAKAQLPDNGNATISVASGVAIGNEIHVGGAQ